MSLKVYQDKIVTPAIQMAKTQPEVSAVLSKLTKSNTPNSSLNGDNLASSNNAMFQQALRKRGKRNADAASVSRLLPDIELSAQILVSSILSPADMTTVDLNYFAPNELCSPELTADALDIIRKHFETVYKIKPLLYKMVREPLFEKGAYPVAVIPENVIDEFINNDRMVSLESISSVVDSQGAVRNMGILGDYKDTDTEERRGVSLEAHYSRASLETAARIDKQVHYKDSSGAYKPEPYLSVTDNISVLKIPQLNRKSNKIAVLEQYKRSGMFTKPGGISNRDVEKATFRTKQYKTQNVANLSPSSAMLRKSVGGPLIMKLPSESVIPIHVPGDVEKHIGYYVALDAEGNPLECADGDQYHAGLSNGFSTTQGSGLSSNLTQRVNNNLGQTQFDRTDQMQLNAAAKVYAEMIERDLLARLKNGTYAANASVVKNEQVYRMMLSRVLAKKYTQLLYIPAEFVTYIAFKYTDDGLGRSLLDDISIISTLRTVLLLSDTMASVKNSISRTRVTATIPENDPNPLKTLEHLQDTIVRYSSMALPLGYSQPQDIVDYVARAAYEWDISGHKGLPDMKLSFENVQSNHIKPDSDLQERLRKSSIMAFGLSPETVDNGFESEFATTAVMNNALLSKRVIMLQDIFCPQLSNHLRQVAVNTQPLVEKLQDLFIQRQEDILIEIDSDDDTGSEGNKKKIVADKVVSDFLALFYVELPRPVSVTLQNQIEELDVFVGALDKALDAKIPSEVMTSETVGDLSNQVTPIRAMIKAYYIRKWMADKGILTELADLSADSDSSKKDNTLLSSVMSNITSFSEFAVAVLSKTKKEAEAVGAELEKKGITPPPSEPAESTEGEGSPLDELGGEEPALDGDPSVTPPDEDAELGTDDQPSGDQDKADKSADVEDNDSVLDQ